MALGLKTSHRNVVNISCVLHDCIDSEALQRGKADGHALEYVIIFGEDVVFKSTAEGPRLISLVVIDGIHNNILLTMNFFSFYSYIYKSKSKRTGRIKECNS